VSRINRKLECIKKCGANEWEGEFRIIKSVNEPDEIKVAA
jgi:hypothetical protein